MNPIAIGTKRHGFRIAACLLAAAAGDWLFYRQPVGWTLGLFALALMALLALRHIRALRSPVAALAALLAALMCLALIEEPTFLAILVSVAAIGFFILLRTGVWVSSVQLWTLRWMHLVIMLPLQALFDSQLVTRWFRRHPRAFGGPAHRRGLSRLLLHWLLPFAGGTVFIILFAVANPIISQWLSTLGDYLNRWLDWLPDFLRPARLALWAALGALVYGLLRHRMFVDPRPARRVPPIQRPQRLKHDLIIRCLLVFNAIFAVQTILDLLYLYGGATLPHGLSYAQYAHRGAYPLIATALLAGAFVLLAFKTGGAAHRSLWARRLVYLWIAQNVLLLAATIWRLVLYVEVYSLSRWRVATMIWIALVAAGFILTVWKIMAHRSNAWLLRANLVSLGATLSLCAFINFPGIIADFNVRHCREITGQGVPLDLHYLQTLGPEALPALSWLEPHLPDLPRHQARDLRQQLQSQLDAQLADWRGWTFRRQRIAHAANPPIEQTASR